MTLDMGSRALLIVLAMLTVGKLAFYGAEWTIKKAGAAAIIAQEAKRPATLVVPAVTVREKTPPAARP